MRVTTDTTEIHTAKESVVRKFSVLESTCSLFGGLFTSLRDNAGRA